MSSARLSSLSSLGGGVVFIALTTKVFFVCVFLLNMNNTINICPPFLKSEIAQFWSQDGANYQF